MSDVVPRETRYTDLVEYVSLEEPIEKSGKINKELEEKTYYYAKEADVKVKYIDSITNEELDTDYIKGYEGKDYETILKTFDGYVFEKDTENTKGQMTKDTIEVIYYYRKAAKVKVLFKNIVTGEEVAESENIAGIIGQNYSTKAKSINKLMLVRNTNNTTGQMTEEETIVIYYYGIISGGVIENHIDIKTGEKLFTDTHTGYLTEEYEINPRTFDNYDLVVEKNPPERIRKGYMEIDPIEVNYYYIRKSKVIVKYVDQDGKELVKTKEINGHEDDNYTTQKLEIDGYIFERVDGETSGKMTRDDKIVIYRYVRKPAEGKCHKQEI